MTNKDQDIFFALIRAAIWTDEDGQPKIERMAEVERLVPAGYDWSVVLNALTDHAMLGIVSSVVVSLPDDKRPTGQLLTNMLDYVSNLVRTHYNLEQEMKTVFSLLEDHGLHPVLLKGEGLAGLYPKTAVRACGDIDLYVPKGEYETAKELLAELCGSDGLGKDSEHHLEMNHDDMTIELHKTPCGSTVDSKYDAFCKWSEERLDYKGSRPDTYYNVLYVFQHLLHHAAFGHPALRQFIDWAFVIVEARRAGVLDEAELAKDLQRYSSVASWQSLSGLLHYQFGMATSDIPLWDAEAAKRSQGDFVKYMTGAGNFGRDQSKGLAHLWHMVKRFYSLWRVMPDVVREKAGKRVRSVCYSRINQNSIL